MASELHLVRVAIKPKHIARGQIDNIFDCPLGLALHEHYNLTDGAAEVNRDKIKLPPHLRPLGIAQTKRKRAIFEATDAVTSMQNIFDAQGVMYTGYLLLNWLDFTIDFEPARTKD